MKLTLERSSINYPAKFPAFTRNLSGEVNVSKTMFMNSLQNATRHWGTPSVATASLGSILETLAVGYAAKRSDVGVLYWEENRYFSGSGPGSGTTFCGGPDRQAADTARVIQELSAQQQGHGVLLLKAVIDTRPLYMSETNSKRRSALFNVIINGATKNSVAAAAATIPKAVKNLRYEDIPRIYNLLKPIPAKNSPWKGFWAVEPDGIFFIYKDGRLYIYILEFKITKGHAETVPSEAWQMAKARMMIEKFFAAYNPIVRTVFVPWQYGQGLNSTSINFRNPYERVRGPNGRPTQNFASNHKFSVLYRTALNQSFEPVVWRKEQFQRETGIDYTIAQAIVEGLERFKTKSISNMSAHIVRWSQVAANAMATGINVARQLTPNEAGVASKNRPAARQAAIGSSNRISNCSGGAYGADQPAIVLRCLPVLGPAQYDDIIRSVQRLTHLRGWVAAPGATAEQYAQAQAVVKKIVQWTKAPQLYSSANLDTKKDVVRLQAWRDRISAPNFDTATITNRSAADLLSLRWIIPSEENIDSILSRVMINASTLGPANVNPLVNRLKTVGAPLNTYKRIFNTSALKNNKVFNAIIARNLRNRSQGTLGNYARNLPSRRNNMGNN